MALIYLSEWAGTSDIRVHETTSQGLADLLVWHTNDQGLARSDEGVWCFVESSGLASSRVFFVSSGGSADLTICLAPSRGLAGWRSSHALQGRL